MEINFYHLAPENMQGTKLIPLNDLKDVYPETYIEESCKYEGRETIMERQVTLLNCLWNDVIHMTAVHPGDIKILMSESGLMKSAREVKKYFVIPLSKLDKENLAVYLMAEESFDHSEIIREETKDLMRQTFSKYESFEMFDSGKIETYKKINILTKKYYKMVGAGDRKRFMIYQFVPHILYKGEIETVGLEVLEI
jgi:hypothetical protein